MRDHVFRAIDALVLPTMPTVYTVDQVLADPIELNSRLGTYTNFVNLLDLCGLAVPAAMRADGAPSGITLLAPAGQRCGARVDRPRVPCRYRLAARRDRPRAAAAGAMLDRVARRRDRARGGRRASLRHAAQRRAAACATRASSRRRRRPRRLSAVTRSPARSRRSPGCCASRTGEGAAIAVEVWALTGGGLRHASSPRFRRRCRSARVRARRRPHRQRVSWSRRAAVDGARDISSFGGWRAFMAEQR